MAYPPPGDPPDPGTEPTSPAVQETPGTWVRSLGWEDPLEEEMATYSSILVWEIPWTEKPGRLQFMGLQKSQT